LPDPAARSTAQDRRLLSSRGASRRLPLPVENRLTEPELSGTGVGKQRVFPGAAMPWRAPCVPPAPIGGVCRPRLSRADTRDGRGDSPRCGSRSFRCLLVAYFVFVPRCPSICLASRSLRTHVFARAPAGPVSSCPPEARRGSGGSEAHGVSSFTAEGRSLPFVRGAVCVSSRRARRDRVAAGACTPLLA